MLRYIHDPFMGTKQQATLGTENLSNVTPSTRAAILPQRRAAFPLPQRQSIHTSISPFTSRGGQQWIHSGERNRIVCQASNIPSNASTRSTGVPASTRESPYNMNSSTTTIVLTCLYLATHVLVGILAGPLRLVHLVLTPGTQVIHVPGLQRQHEPSNPPDRKNGVFAINLGKVLTPWKGVTAGTGVYAYDIELSFTGTSP